MLRREGKKFEKEEGGMIETGNRGRGERDFNFLRFDITLVPELE